MKIDGTDVSGTLDLIIRDEFGQEKVWDVKSASEWAFKFKYTGYGGYEKIRKMIRLDTSCKVICMEKQLGCRLVVG